MGTVHLQPLFPPIFQQDRVVGTGSPLGQACSLDPRPWRPAKSLESLPSRAFLWLLPPSVQYMHSQAEEPVGAGSKWVPAPPSEAGLPARVNGLV